MLPEDTAAMFLWRNDVAAAKLDMPYRPVDWMSHNNWLGEMGKDPTRVLFAIRTLEAPSIIGFAALTGINPVYRSADLGIRIGQESNRGQGYGRDAAVLVLDYAWKTLNLDRIQLDVFAGNARAIRSYRSAGFEHEGTRRRAAFIDGEWLDVAIMGALRPMAEPARAIASEENVVDLTGQIRPANRISAI
jgi:RimJ/RimL family protein N-acetyltransferase